MTDPKLVSPAPGYERARVATDASVPYCVGAAYYGGYDHDHLAGVLQLEWGDPNLHVIRTHGVPYIDQARAIIATSAMALMPEKDAVLVFLDHDIIFDPRDVPRLVDAIASSPYDVLAVPYSMRKHAGGLIGFPTPHPSGETPLSFFELGGFYDSIGVGMGFTAIKLSTFWKMAAGEHFQTGEQIAEPMRRYICGTQNKVYPFFAHLLEGELYLGEDMSFCRRVAAAGGRVGLWTVPRIGHKGTYIYAPEDCAFAVPVSKRLTLKLRVQEDFSRVLPGALPYTRDDTGKWQPYEAE